MSQTYLDALVQVLLQLGPFLVVPRPSRNQGRDVALVFNLTHAGRQYGHANHGDVGHAAQKPCVAHGGLLSGPTCGSTYDCRQFSTFKFLFK